VGFLWVSAVSGSIRWGGICSSEALGCWNCKKNVFSLGQPWHEVTWLQSRKRKNHLGKKKSQAKNFKSDNQGDSFK
jgi:hypothetical protein